MNKGEELWDLLVQEGLAVYEARANQAHYSTLILIGAAKSVLFLKILITFMSSHFFLFHRGKRRLFIPF